MTTNTATEGTANAGIDRLVAAEQLRMVLSHTALGTVAATTFAIFMALHIRAGALGALVHPSWVDLWLLAKVSIAAARVWHAHLYRLRGCPDAEHWTAVTIVLLAVDGVIWGAGGAALMAEKSEVANFASAVICCIACVATFGLQSHWKATCAYVGPMVSAVILAYFTRADQLGWMGGVGTAVFLGLLLASARRSERHMKEVFRLRHQTERVSAKLADALALAERRGTEKDAALALAEKHNAAREVFLAVVSHELRSPLHSMLGLTRLARTELPATTSTNTLYRLDLVVQAGEHLRRLLNDLLDVSAMRSGKLDIVSEPFDLRQELTALEASYAAQANEDGIGFSVVTSELGGGLVVGDEVRVTQILANLLGNAFKFTSLGGRVKLTAVRSEVTPDLVTFTVSDNGPGIPQDQREHIFEMFGQVSDTTTSRPKGVGLGLWISRELALAMGGSVVCESTIGRGSAFSLSVPLPIAAVPPPAPWIAHHGTALAPGMLVAIADDDPVSRLVTAAALRTVGADVLEFEDGAQVLAAMLQMRQRRPDVLVLDWHMPVVGGAGVVSAIRAHEGANYLDRVPIIILSAAHSSVLQEVPSAPDMDLVLTKPCAPADIVNAVVGSQERTAQRAD